jgi:hypothetical protein
MEIARGGLTHQPLLIARAIFALDPIHLLIVDAE